MIKPNCVTDYLGWIAISGINISIFSYPDYLTNPSGFDKLTVLLDAMPDFPSYLTDSLLAIPHSNTQLI